MNPMMMEEEDDMGPPVPESDEDIQAMLEELAQAEEAGDNYEAQNAFGDVPGAEPVVEESEGMDEEKLKMLLASMGG